jgi:hypothetical protein
MRPVVISKTGAGSSSIVPLDHYQSPFNVGIGVVVSGTVDYTIQHTYDDVQNAAVTPTWFNNATIAGKTGNFDGGYTLPVTAVKLLVNSGTGTATATIIQAGMPGK